MITRLTLFVMLALVVSACGGAAPDPTQPPPTVESSSEPEPAPVDVGELPEGSVRVVDEAGGNTFVMDLAEGWTQSESIPSRFVKDTLMITLSTSPEEVAPEGIENMTDSDIQEQLGSITTETLQANGQDVVRVLIEQEAIMLDIYQRRLDDETVVTLSVQGLPTEATLYQNEVLAMLGSIQLR